MATTHVCEGCGASRYQLYLYTTFYTTKRLCAVCGDAWRTYAEQHFGRWFARFLRQRSTTGDRSAP